MPANNVNYFLDRQIEREGGLIQELQKSSHCNLPTGRQILCDG